MNEKQVTRTSKFLSLVLRHEPGKIGLNLDSNGWVLVDDLLTALRQHGKPLERTELEEVVATNDKKRFAFSEDGQKIRASQGHSVEVDLDYTPQAPPEFLYHGTATRFLPSISLEGLLAGDRHHVHLSAEKETALQVGQRHGTPAVLVVKAAAMLEQGKQFFRSENGVWLTEHVPVEFIEFPSPDENAPAPVGKRSSRARLAKETLAICEEGHYTTSHGQRVELGAEIRAAVTGTILYTPEEWPIRPSVESVMKTKITVTSETTIAALRRLEATPGGHLACLNFASAKNAGGGFLGGSEAQEESLARSSALYGCLLAAPEYYARNRAHSSALYQDLIIWSPEVPFFRDDSGALLDRPILASVITAPAPNAGAVTANRPSEIPEIKPTLRRRAAYVLAVAADQGVRRFVLGAWGCGVFRNDPGMVAQVFSDLLLAPDQFAGAFDEVVFAIYDRSSDQAVVRSFEEYFR